MHTEYGKLSHSGTDGRTYGGDPNLIHIPDHHRQDVGEAVADCLDTMMRMVGTLGVGHDPKPMSASNPLCPGCYMIALFDAAVFLAARYGQDPANWEPACQSFSPRWRATALIVPRKK